MITLPLAEFEKRGSSYSPTGYIPPALRIRTDSTLANLCAPVRKVIRRKAGELGQALASGSQLGPSDKHKKEHQLQSLVAELPAFEALLNSGEAHPFQLHLALCSLAGSVSCLSHARIPAEFAPYDHFNPGASYEAVLGFIRQAIAEGLIENWCEKDFSRFPAGLFEIGPTIQEALPDNADLAHPYFGLMLRVPAGENAAAIREWGKTCILASSDAVQQIEITRDSGLHCEPVDGLDDLSPAPDSVLFRVKIDPRKFNLAQKLVLKSARLEFTTPAAATLCIRKQTSGFHAGA
jgi:type VI secretion system protein ImpJ